MTTVTSPKKAPAKAAPAKPAAEKAPAPTTPARLRWTADEEGRKAKEPWPTSASVDGRDYRIARGEGASWVATVTVDGTTEMLSNSSFGAAYGACLAHHRAH